MTSRPLNSKENKAMCRVRNPKGSLAKTPAEEVFFCYQVNAKDSVDEQEHGQVECTGLHVGEASPVSFG